MKASKLLLLGALLAVMPPTLVGTLPAEAQPASAIGKPLPQKSTPLGTVTVRVIAGNVRAAVAGTEVTLLVNNEPRKARTNNEGRASFDKLSPGVTVQAVVDDDEGKPTQSEPFPVPSDSGVVVMLTTKPMESSPGGGAAAGPMAGGGMPEARVVSGKVIADAKLPGGTLLVRITHNNLQMIDGRPKDPQPPAGEPVHLVGYSADDTVDFRTAKANAEGGVTFDNLDQTGNTVYFALTALPRNGGFDRMRSNAVQPDPQSGAKMVLSGEKPDSAAPFVDDHKLRRTETPPGKIRISLEGNPHLGQTVKIIDAATKKVLAEAPAVLPPPDEKDVQSASQFQLANNLPAGKLEVQLHGGNANENNPIPDVGVKLVPADDPKAEGVTLTTAKDGWFETMLPTTGKHRAIYTIKGKEFTSDPFEVSQAGGRLDVLVRWGTQAPPEVLVDAPVEPTVVYAESVVQGNKLSGTFRSLPFQVVPTAGVHVPILIYPRLFFTFTLKVFVEDEQLGVQGRWTVFNTGWAPYKGEGDDGVLIRAPRGHKAGILAGNNQNDVAVVPNEGFRLMRPIPPGEKTFIAGFTMPIDRGTAELVWDLPNGTNESHIEIKQMQGMVVDAPKGAQTGTGRGNDGATYYVIDGINVDPGQTMQLAIRKLPAAPLWRVWAPRFVAGFVIALMAVGIVYALSKKKKPAVDSAARVRRAALLDELVELERSGDNPKRREQVMAELERIWIQS
ncbi:MAG: hypothetical protein KIT31_04910 [Deltaproteobacteria bacterium]|nr:hypothetical protein [Deltaproteobacteria bacterium]